MLVKALTESSKPVVERHQHNVLVQQIIWTVDVAGSSAREPSAPVDVDHHRQLLPVPHLEPRGRQQVAFRADTSFG